MGAAERRITQVGNSLGLTLPAEMLKKLNITKGDEVNVIIQEDGLFIRKAPQWVELPKGIPAEFFDVLNEEMETYHDTLKGLVDR